ncbi:MAG: thioredoxin family protein [Actinobacteria bacterium]|nr:thioredoxin family protein [Actinomycetota bacterium]
MKSTALLVLILLISTAIGFWYRSKNGVIRKKRRLHIGEAEFAGTYGKRITILQFSTTFCSQCRAAKALINDVVKDEKDISYLEIDAESNLALVRKVDVRSTPTTIFLDKDGYEIARATGAPKRDQLQKVIASL